MEKAYQRLVLSSFVQKLVSSFLLLSAFVLLNVKEGCALTLISDEETEQYLAHLVSPLFAEAKIPFHRNKFFIVQDNSLNAFVGDGNNLFVHTGTILAADNSNELEGVLAHEIGHISGGHILRGKIEAQRAQQVSLASALVAGTAAVISGRGDVGLALALGGQTSTLNNYLSYRTSEERSADETAVRLLKAQGKSTSGLLTFMKKISQNNRLSGIEESPYFRTHPITQERISFLEKQQVKNSFSENDENFKRVKAKLQGFLMPPEKTLQIYKSQDTSIPSRYARAIAHFRKQRTFLALKEVSELIKSEPNNPYFYELKAQIFMETGKTKQAEVEYFKALEYMPQSSLFKIYWAQAALENNPSPAKLKKIIQELNQAVLERPYGFVYLLLGKAYEENRDFAYAQYAAAEYNFSIGEIKIAQRQVDEAEKLNKNNEILKNKINDLQLRIEQIKKKE